MPRTGSSGSKVGPAVINTRCPCRIFGWKNAQIASNVAEGSSIRPSPTSPHACTPESGPSTCTPSPRSCATLRCVAGFCHIWRFIAGTTSSGQSRATQSVESRSSQLPCASLAMKSVEAGAITIASASRDRSMCAMLLAIRASHCDVYTGRPDSACMVTGVMNWVAASVMTICTVAPAFTSRRVSSAIL